jgi:thiol-disulfide isomerase/thioredoxin
MKKLKIILLTFIACVSTVAAQEIKTENKKTGTPQILVGEQDRAALTIAPFDSWFSKNYEAYQVDEADLKKLKPLLKRVKIKVFMGTWCGDSKRETPRFYKIMDAAKVKQKNITLITMDRSKKTPDNLEEGLDITNVPTFIFYKKGKEINRIVEYPVETLEKDMLALLSKANYKHAYAD